MLRDAKCQCFDMRMMTTNTRTRMLNTYTRTLTVSQLRMINNLLTSVCKCVHSCFHYMHGCCSKQNRTMYECWGLYCYSSNDSHTHSLSYCLSENYLHGFFSVMVNKWQIEYGDNFCSRRYNAIHLGCEKSVTHPIRWVDILSVFVYNHKAFIIKNWCVANTHGERRTYQTN